MRGIAVKSAREIKTLATRIPGGTLGMSLDQELRLANRVLFVGQAEPVTVTDDFLELDLRSEVVVELAPGRTDAYDVWLVHNSIIERIHGAESAEIAADAVVELHGDYGYPLYWCGVEYLEGAVPGAAA